MIPIHHCPCLVHEDGSITVAIVGDADVGPVFQHRFLHHVGVEGSASVVDVDPVGLDIHRDHHRPQLVENRRGHLVRGPVGAIYHNLDPMEGYPFGDGSLGKLDVPTSCVIDPIGLPDLSGQRAETLDFPARD